MRERFGAEAPSRASLKRILATVQGVDPINFAPALLAGYQYESGHHATIHPDAWSFFLTTLHPAGDGFPLR